MVELYEMPKEFKFGDRVQFIKDTGEYQGRKLTTGTVVATFETVNRFGGSESVLCRWDNKDDLNKFTEYLSETNVEKLATLGFYSKDKSYWQVNKRDLKLIGSKQEGVEYMEIIHKTKITTTVDLANDTMKMEITIDDDTRKLLMPFACTSETLEDDLGGAKRYKIKQVLYRNCSTDKIRYFFIPELLETGKCTIKAEQFPESLERGFSQLVNEATKLNKINVVNVEVKVTNEKQ